MPTGSGANQDQAVDTSFQRAASVTNGCDVVQDETTVTMHALYDFRGSAQAGNDDRHAEAHTGFDIRVQPIAVCTNDQVDAMRRHVRLVLLAGLSQGVVNARKPYGKLLLRSRVEGREGADDPTDALRYDGFGIRNDEHR